MAASERSKVAGAYQRGKKKPGKDGASGAGCAFKTCTHVKQAGKGGAGNLGEAGVVEMA